MAPPKPTEREIPMEVLCLGLCRTGTTSTREALLQLGYKNVHHMRTVSVEAPWEPDMWVEAFDAKFGNKGKLYGKEEFDILLSRYDAVTDTPAACFPEELMLAYPNAKLVLTERDSVDAWMRSIHDTLFQLSQLALGPNQPLGWRLLTNYTPMGKRGKVPRAMFKYSPMAHFDDDPDSNRRWYLEHNENVKRLAKEQGRELLVFNVKEGWEPLCTFLGKEVPEGPYPKSNETADMQRAIRVLKSMRFVADVTVKAVGVAGVVLLGIWLSRRFRI